MKTGYGPTIRELLAEAENERMHLMFFIDIAKPNALERALILAAQAIFWNYYFVFYVFFPKTAHKMIHYFEEEAVSSYTQYLEMIESGEIEGLLLSESCQLFFPSSRTLRRLCIVATLGKVAPLGTRIAVLRPVAPKR